MQDLTRELLMRTKKYLWFIIILPLLLAFLGYLYSVKQYTPTTYSASTKIVLGQYDNKIYNTNKESQRLLTSTKFLSEVLVEINNDVNEVKQSLQVINTFENELQINYRGNSQESVEKVLNSITNGFLEKDVKNYNLKLALIEENIQQLQPKQVDESSIVDKQRFLYELMDKKNNLKKAEIIEPLKISSEQGGLSPKKRGVLGLLIGITLSLAFIFLPVLFKESNNVSG